jgi:hypothetical protein
MAERWISRNKRSLERLKELTAKKDKDRLELVKTMNTCLYLVGRSLSGWSTWVNNPSAMANFTQEELAEMEQKLTEFTESFLEYDVKVTELGLEKGLNKRNQQTDQVRFVV